MAVSLSQDSGTWPASWSLLADYPVMDSEKLTVPGLAEDQAPGPDVQTFGLAFTADGVVGQGTGPPVPGDASDGQDGE